MLEDPRRITLRCLELCHSTLRNVTRIGFLSDRSPAVIHSMVVYAESMSYCPRDHSVHQIAVLHDVPEDCHEASYSGIYDEISKMGCSSSTIDSIRLLDRRSCPDLTYDQYITRLLSDYKARLVKKIDLRANSIFSPSFSLSKKGSLEARYEKALILIDEFEKDIGFNEFLLTDREL